MSDTYTKLFSSITESTVWSGPYSMRIVWITMLAMADASGDLYGSIPGLARRANVTIEEAEAALMSFLHPDPYSRTKENDGRRVEEIDGGWQLINHRKYRAIRNEEERRATKREYDRKNRPSGHERAKQKAMQSERSPTQSDKRPPQSASPAPPTPTPAPTPRESESGARALAPEAAEQTATALRDAGCPDAHQHDQRLVEAVFEGLGPTLVALAGTKKGKDKTLAYLLATVRGQREDAAQHEPTPTAPARAAAASPLDQAREELDNRLIEIRHLAEVSRMIDEDERARLTRDARAKFDAAKAAGAAAITAQVGKPEAGARRSTGHQN